MREQNSWKVANLLFQFALSHTFNVKLSIYALEFIDRSKIKRREWDGRINTLSTNGMNERKRSFIYLLSVLLFLDFLEEEKEEVSFLPLNLRLSMEISEYSQWILVLPFFLPSQIDHFHREIRDVEMVRRMIPYHEKDEERAERENTREGKEEEEEREGRGWYWWHTLIGLLLAR